MTLFRNKYRIESTRLLNWDYSQPGYYFITICEKAKTPLFGFIKNNTVALNEFGLITQYCWADIPNHFPFVSVDEYCIMPNHLHGIVCIRSHKTTAVLTGFSPGSDPSGVCAGGSVIGDKNSVETQNLASLQISKQQQIPKNKTDPKTIRDLKSDIQPNSKKSKISGNEFGTRSACLGAIIKGFKIGVTKYARGNNIPFQWQGRFYDHVIKDKQSLLNIRQYIRNNPLNWQDDEENPVKKSLRYVAMPNPQRAYL